MTDSSKLDILGTDDEDVSPATGPRQPVVNVIRDYHAKRKAWLEEAERLATMRDQVRAAADLETMQIVTRARQRARDVIAHARRQLLVLNEQVRASIGEPARTDQAVKLLGDSLRQPANEQARAHFGPPASDGPDMRSAPSLQDRWADLAMPQDEDSKTRQDS